MFLQPQVNTHGKVYGAEALVRWIDANGKCKSPMEFIPVFEANGFIYKLDCFMWEMVCKVIRRWLDTGRQPLPISVNVSRTYLQKEDVAGYIKNLIDKYQIPMELFQLEITETTENAESLSQLYERSSSFVQEVLLPLEKQYETVLVVAHGALNRSILNEIEEIPVSDFWHFPMENCSLGIIECRRGKLKLIDYINTMYEK